MSPDTPDAWLLGVHAAATLFMVGLIWFVQVVHYPLFGQVGGAGFSAYHRLHSRNTAWVVGLPMCIELVTAVAVAWRWGGTWTLVALTLLAIIWISTWLLQVPAHARLEQGFDAATHRRLVNTNWVRTAAWSGRGVIAIVMFAQGR
jgi:hypothetical protein